MTKLKVVIIGGGPTGLGAAHRLTELGHTDWILLETSNCFGGLASSVVDEQGFTWDLGGHVLFSHYDYFDSLTDSLLGDAWLHHIREAWIRMRSRWIPYPFQNNLRHLPEDDLLYCLRGLVDLSHVKEQPPPKTFDDWILKTFGSGIADVFMRPYNFKTWAYDPKEMNVSWMGDRVATIDLNRVLESFVHQRDEVSWGPNATFRFPASGGTGSIWNALADRLPADKLLRKHEVAVIDPDRKVLRCQNGEEFRYDVLISTMPLNVLLQRLVGYEDLTNRHTQFLWSSSHIVGLGIEGDPPDQLATKCWIYFPEGNTPFYRATVFSNYAPANVPKPGQQWSLMCEVSESVCKPVNHSTIIEETRKGLEQTGLITPEDKVLSEWHHFLPYGYPTPFIDRDVLLADIEPRLRAMSIYSRGRFGGWKYEVSNQDHSLMQGVECVDHILNYGTELTYFDPITVNGR